jgi:hypothetical protein
MGRPKRLWAAERVVKSKLHGKLIAYNIHVYHGKSSRDKMKKNKAEGE